MILFTNNHHLLIILFIIIIMFFYTRTESALLSTTPASWTSSPSHPSPPSSSPSTSTTGSLQTTQIEHIFCQMLVIQPAFLHCLFWGQNIFSKSYIWNFDKTPLICWCHKHPLLLQPRYKTQWIKLGVIKAIRKTHGQRGDRTIVVILMIMWW